MNARKPTDLKPGKAESRERKPMHSEPRDENPAATWRKLPK
jgi:hypothetical protein